ncbi:hypothetical protein ACFQS1_28560 [Paractinoplanes rhizophilus]|uniref:Uncharacterized protein n=1 Tax=Paractinoplanes rhizophilus TaxID=1416877 RepID=A0ABW2HXN3_9ACTN|nr:hypothetical protein [Actinoplanes sp.]
MLTITPGIVGNSVRDESEWSCLEQSSETFGLTRAEGEVTSTMSSIVDRVRERRMINRENRAIDRAWKSAPTQAMRDEIAIFAQRKTF